MAIGLQSTAGMIAACGKVPKPSSRWIGSTILRYAEELANEKWDVVDRNVWFGGCDYFCCHIGNSPGNASRQAEDETPHCSSAQPWAIETLSCSWSCVFSPLM
jgi:hypothetical protein